MASATTQGSLSDRPSTKAGGSGTTSLAWLDALKGVAIVWIFLVHLTERLFGSPFIGNPSPNWPTFGERLGQLAPMDGYGAWTPLLDVLRWLGWAGDQGVQLFLTASGFGLAWGLLRRGAGPRISAPTFYRRRLLRIYPMWWGAHFAALCAGFLLAHPGFAVGDSRFLLSVVGIRCTPETLYYISPAWWYIGLLLQLYAVFPLIWRAAQRWGPGRLLAGAVLVGVVSRLVGLYALTDWLDTWNRGAFFPTRLPEFVFGVSLAHWLWRDPQVWDRRLRRIPTFAVALAVHFGATALSLTLWGCGPAPFLLGTAAFVILYGLLRPAARFPRLLAPLRWLGKRSYGLYLCHHPVVFALVPDHGAQHGVLALVGSTLAVVLTPVAALALERAVDATTRSVRAIRQRGGWRALARRALVIGAAALATLVAGEAAVRTWAPQEVWGWGERPALEPHDRWGWRLKPSRTTRLSWVGYDYVVTANSLGLPGPEPARERPPDGLRVLTVGDAFTSGEGVDTARAWPRVLERELSARVGPRPVEVVNAGITGYGPNQYAAVVRDLAPQLRPDVIVIGLFVNDVFDAVRSDENFRQWIGFGRRDPDSVRAWLLATHLRQFLRLRALAPVREVVHGEPDREGVFLANLNALDRTEHDALARGEAVLDLRLAEIARHAAAGGTRVVVLLIPAPPQVTPPQRLDYFPRHIDLTDEARWDLEQPQRLGRALADRHGFACWDLREPLRPIAADAYFPFNMHWTERAHAAVGTYVAEHLLASRLLPPSAPAAPPTGEQRAP